MSDEQERTQPIEPLSDPSVFIDVCHLTPEGIDRLAEAFLPEVAELVEQTEEYKRWRGTQGGGGRR